MNELSALLDMTCTVDIGLMSINYTCFDGNDAFSQSVMPDEYGGKYIETEPLGKVCDAF